MSQVVSSSKLNAIGTASIPRLLLAFSVPAIVSMVVESLYNVVDRYFVAAGVGYLGIAGITLCFPISLFIMALSMIVGIGGNTLFAIRLGEKKYGQAALILNNAFSLLILMAIVSLVLGEIFMEPLLRSFGASEETLPYAASYMRIILFGAVFQTVTPGMNHFIRSLGHPKTAMFRNLIGAGLNTFFDWLFIMKFHWGIEGAAWATVLSQCITTFFVMQFFFKKSTPIKISWNLMKLKLPYVRRIYIMGLPPSVMQICNSLMNVILNRSLVHYGNASTYGGDLAVSAFGVINSIAMLMMMPVMGFIQGGQPIIGYNYGAKAYTRVKSTLKILLIFAVGFMVCAWLLVQLKAEWLVGFFTANNSLLAELSARSIRAFLLALPMIACGMVCGNFFQGTGKPGRAMFLNMCRQLIVLIPVLLILPLFLGLRGVFFAGPISDTISAILSVILLRIELRKMR